jgi:hypothetical protein
MSPDRGDLPCPGRCRRRIVPPPLSLSGVEVGETTL